MTTQQLDLVKKVVRQCVREYSLSQNPAMDETILSLNCFPKASSKKMAFLILTYKREATTEELARISSQPAGLIRDLRKDGFIFKGDGKGNNYLFKNAKGETCRSVVGYKKPKAEIKGRLKAVLEKSVAACVSAIEIYNKPDFKYREETFSILLVNAWELLLKAKILAINDNDIRSIQATDKEGNTKLNRAGNPLTIDINYALQQLVDQKLLDARCRENISLLMEIRDNAIHFINKSKNLNRKIQEVGTAGLSNYVTAVGEWFDKDLSQYNFYLMPMSFFHVTDIESHSILHSDKQIENILKHFQSVEDQYPSDASASYNITLRIQTHFVKASSTAQALDVRYTDNPEAPEIRVSEESIFKNKYPLTYAALVEKLKDRYINFRPDNRFHKIKKELEDQEKHLGRFCRINYLNVIEKKGSQQKFYSMEILKEFDKHYTKRK